MNPKTHTELALTRAKLRRLEAHYDARRGQPAADEALREMSLRSVKRTINQLKEEIARFETLQPSPR